MLAHSASVGIQARRGCPDAYPPATGPSIHEIRCRFPALSPIPSVRRGPRHTPSGRVVGGPWRADPARGAEGHWFERPIPSPIAWIVPKPPGNAAPVSKTENEPISLPAAAVAPGAKDTGGKAA